MVEKVDVYSDKSNGSKIYAFDYLRVIALVMILYDHLGGFYSKFSSNLTVPIFTAPTNQISILEAATAVCGFLHCCWTT